MLVSLLLGTVDRAAAETGIVAGDSLGVGVSMASRLRSFAKNSVSIRASGVPVEQISEAPSGSVVFLSLGTNDAVSNISGLSGGIDRIVAAAAKAQVKLVWIGPPCVFKPWDKNAIALDGILQQSLQGTGVTYVSMRDPKLCDRSVRAKDGVHFSMTGYHYMWNKAASAAGFVVASSDISDGSTKATTHKAKKKKKRKLRRKRRASSAHGAPAETGAPPSAPPPSPAPQ